MVIIGVASANRPEAIRQLLPSLRKQTVCDDSENTKIVIFNGTARKNEIVFDKYLDLQNKNPDIHFIHHEGGPALGRNLLRRECKDSDYFVLLDDDTFPKYPNTISDMILFLDESKADIVSGVWECEKQKYRPYGEVIEFMGRLATRKPLREKGVHKIHIPLATLVAKGSDINRISFDSNIEFYGDMFDIGMSIKTKEINCLYNTEFVFEHKNIPNDKSVKFKRPSAQWGYLAEKWNVSLFQSGRLLSPNKVKSNYLEEGRKVFIVEFNQYHFETIPSYAELFYNLGFQVEVLIRPNKLEVDVGIKKVCPNAEIRYINSIEHALSLLKERAKKTDFCFLNSSGFVDKVSFGEELKFYNCSYIDNVLDLDIFDFEKVVVVHHDAKRNISKRALSVKEVCLQPMMAKLHGFHYLPPIKKTTDKIRVNKNVFSKKFIVAGLIEKERRDYDKVQAAFSSAVLNEGSFNHLLHICGAVPGPSKSYMNNIIKKAQLSGTDRCYLFPKLKGQKIKNSVFEESLKSSDFIILGTDPYNKTHASYLRNKGSGVVSLIIDHGIIPICHKYFAIAYGINSVSIVYDDVEKSLEDAIVECMKMSYNEMLSYHIKIKELQSILNRSNIDNLLKILKLKV